MRSNRLDKTGFHSKTFKVILFIYLFQHIRTCGLFMMQMNQVEIFVSNFYF